MAQPVSSFVILIPAYEPDATLISVIGELLRLGEDNAAFAGVIVVDDGSLSDVAKDAFARLRDMQSVTLVTHETNQGKGGALKTGFTYALQNMPDAGFIVTADADGQHKPADIIRVAEAAIQSGKPSIGYRRFSSDVPLRSRFGNLVTVGFFKVATGVHVFDTQSGLRAYLREDLPALIEIKADRYEYEFHCLFYLVNDIRRLIEQVSIETVYESGNPTSHFNPLMDSLRIYSVFLRYVSVSAISGLCDFLFFSILTLFGVPTLLALIFSRLGSAPIYFYGMRNIAFKSKGNIATQALGTALLMIVHIFFLWRFIEALEVWFGVHPIGAMFAGLLVFYISNFLIQRFIIYPWKSAR